MRREPTKGQNLLDLFCCNKPSLVKSITSIPCISDHNIVLADCKLKPSIVTKQNLKFRHIGYNVDSYGQSFFPKCISAWNGLAQEIAEANTLDLFKSKLAH